MMMAGRDISVDDMTFGATRIMNVCMAVGQAAGNAASMAINENLKPSEINVNELREKLIKQKAILSI